MRVVLKRGRVRGKPHELIPEHPPGGRLVVQLLDLSANSEDFLPQRAVVLDDAEAMRKGDAAGEGP